MQPAAARRADAERNRGKILAAARSAFADPAADVSMAEISRRAGVGMATLYRNFPGRRELLEALYTDEVNGICEAAETVDGDLLAWLRRFFGFVASKHHIAAELLEHTDPSNPLFGGGRARVTAAGRPLLDAAQRAHDVRDDVTLEQILDMIIAIATIRGDGRYLAPILETALDGLRPRLWDGPMRDQMARSTRSTVIRSFSRMYMTRYGPTFSRR
jgi:AcrR family transcriptional regulator